MTDWEQLARDVGSLHEGGESGGSHLAMRAIEVLLGDERIDGAVEHILDRRPGAELAMNVLRHIVSLRAAEVAHAAYRASTGERRNAAAWLLKHIAHPRSVEWVPELLADSDVAVWGVGLLDQLLWCERVEPESVEHLIVAAERHETANVQEQAAFIRSYLASRSSER